MDPVRVVGNQDTVDVLIDEHLFRQFGAAGDVLDVPRSLSAISPADINRIPLRDPRSFAFFTPNAYTDSAFGNPNVPKIRGQFSDTYINGMRNSFTVSGSGFPMNYSAVEMAQIVKGPPGAEEGAVAGVGGSVNLITKRASLKERIAAVTFTVGSYEDRRWEVDLGMPIDEQQGIRFIYAGQSSGSYYRSKRDEGYFRFFAVFSG